MATAVEHALVGCGELQREATALAMTLDELGKALLIDAALTMATQHVSTGADAAEKAAAHFRRASSIISSASDTEGNRIAYEVIDTTTGLQEIRREIESVLKRISEINALIRAQKTRVETMAATVMGLKQNGQEYAHRLAR